MLPINIEESRFMAAKRDHAWMELSRGGANLEVEDFLSAKLARLGALIHRRVTQRYLARHDLTLPEWRMLALLINEPQVSAATVNSKSAMDKRQVSRALVLLTKRGLVRRGVDRQDGRRRLLTVTREGRRRYDRIVPEARRSHAELLGLLTVSERKALLRILAKLSVAVEQRDPIDDRVARVRGLRG